MGDRRPRGGRYPLWIGLIALGGLTAIWALRDPPAPDTAAPPSDAPQSVASAPASTPNTDARPIPELVWHIDGAAPQSGAAIGACLRAGGWGQLTAHGGGAHPISVTHRLLVLPSLLTRDGERYTLRTRMANRRHRAFALHSAITGCVGGERLEDAALGPLADAESWPGARRDAGMRIDLLVKIAPRPDGLITTGLGRIGLFDLAWRGADTPLARQRLQHAAALVLLADDPALATMQYGAGEATLASADAIGPKTRWITLPPTPAPTVAAPTTRRPRRPTRRKRVKQPRPKAPPSKAPASRWRPDYF